MIFSYILSLTFISALKNCSVALFLYSKKKKIQMIIALSVYLLETNSSEKSSFLTLYFFLLHSQ